MKPSALLRKIIEEALAGKWPLTIRELGSRRQNIGIALNPETLEKLEANAEGLNKSAYVAHALDSYMQMNPLPDEVGGG
jgi:hypothetical protein